MLLGKLIDEAIAVVEAQGFDVRYEHLGGSGSGHCQLGERRWMVIDVAQPTDEQLDQLAVAIASWPIPAATALSDELRACIESMLPAGQRQHQQ